MSDEITKMSGEVPHDDAYDNPGANGVDRDTQHNQDLVKKLSDLDASICFRACFAAHYLFQLLYLTVSCQQSGLHCLLDKVKQDMQSAKVRNRKNVGTHAINMLNF